jgi:hypothetical protein
MGKYSPNLVALHVCKLKLLLQCLDGSRLLALTGHIQ